MSNKIAIGKRFRIGQLLEEFDTAGHASKIVTIRGRGEPGPGLADSGEIEHDGTLTQAQADAVINVHTPGKTSDQILFGAKADAILAASPGTLTDEQRDKVLQYLIKRERGLAEDID